MNTYDELKAEFRCTYDGGDPWGSVMSWLFSIAEESQFNRDGKVAASLQYSPGMITEPDENNQGIELLNAATDEDLERFSVLLNRMYRCCVHKGLNY